MKRYLIIFHTVDPKPPETYYSSHEGMTLLFARIVELTKNRAKFCVFEVGECVGDFS